MPSPTLVFMEMIALFSDAGFYLALLSTLVKSLICLLVALIVALAFAVLSYEIKLFERLLYPLVLIVRSTPTMSLIFLCLIWFSSEISPVIVSFAVLFPMLYATFLSSLNGVDKGVLDMSRVYNVQRSVVFRKVYLPHVFHSVYGDCVAALSFNVKLIVAAEAWAQTKQSIGLFMYKANVNLLTARLFALTVVAILLGFLLELFLKGIYVLFSRKKLCRA